MQLKKDEIIMLPSSSSIIRILIIASSIDYFKYVINFYITKTNVHFKSQAEVMGFPPAESR